MRRSIHTVGRCATCGKLKYTSKGEAKRAAKTFHASEKRMRVYRCGEYWHIGHLPSDIIRGEVSRKERYGEGTEDV